jgi:uncharacterized membrane protein (DUF4010 family)
MNFGDTPPVVATFPHLETLTRLGLALASGLFVGLEREWRGKEAGLRTFGFAALLGGLGGLLGQAYALVSIVLLGVLIAFMNWQTIRADEGTELTTSAALLVMGFTGVLCGLGHTFTPVAVTCITAGLLAWKERLAGFSVGLTAAELRSAILLGLLAFVIYPILPNHAIDPWGLVEPQTAWSTVILIAAIGFVNYVLWKLYGSNGVGLTGFLGGLVNSTVTVTELANRVRESGGYLVQGAYGGVLLATAASMARNGVLLGLLALGTLADAWLPLALMVVSSLALALLPMVLRWLPPRVTGTTAQGSAGAGDTGIPPSLPLESPFSLSSALKFGLIFLALEVVGTLAQQALGQYGFYAVSIVGGLVSSASAVASAGTLAARGALTTDVAARGAVLAALTSAVVNFVLVARLSGSRRLGLRLGQALALVLVLGIAGMAVAPLASSAFAAAALGTLGPH